MIDVKARPQILLRKRMEVAAELPYVVAVEEPFLYALSKRLLDIIVSFVALVLLAPLLALIALIIRLDSPGPALFRQQRVGRWGKEFIVFKFRTMYYKADEAVHREFAKKYIRGQGEKDAQGCFKPKNDARITRVGRILRQTSLDELPQLINVLKGDMSLVGPRPAVRYEVDEYERWQLRRLAVLPGMTGLAQISGRSGLTFEKIMRLDIEYVEKRNLFADIKIALLTVPMLIVARYAS